MPPLPHASYAPGGGKNPTSLKYLPLLLPLCALQNGHGGLWEVIAAVAKVERACPLRLIVLGLNMNSNT